jgi:hypothetical protein
MSLQNYQDTILEGIVRPCFDEGQKLALEEDGDSGHGTGRKANVVKAWKQETRSETLFNTPGSLGLSPIENCWGTTRQFVRANRSLAGMVADSNNLALAGRARIPPSKIYQMMNSMVVRI